MPAQRSSLLLVPPSGGRVHHLRIRPLLLLVVVLLLGAGFAGYFIPFNHFAIDVVEQNQNRNLEQQNRKLLERILLMLNNLNEVRQEIAVLEKKRVQIERVTGTGDHQPEHLDEQKRYTPSLGADALHALVTEFEHRAQHLEDHLAGDASVFASLPILLPVVEEPVISAEFGRVRDPFTNTVKQHTGVDFVGRRGAPVVATANGIVAETGYDKRWGRYVLLRHSSTHATWYAHLDDVSTARGRRLNRGDVIGTLGSTGLSTGPHLHYEIRRDGKPVNPRRYWHPALASRVVSAVVSPTVASVARGR